MELIKEYKPSTNSLGSGQVLHAPYTFDKAKLIVREMTDLLVLDLVDKGKVTDQMVLTVGYDVDSLKMLAHQWGLMLKSPQITMGALYRNIHTAAQILASIPHPASKFWRHVGAV